MRRGCCRGVRHRDGVRPGSGAPDSGAAGAGASGAAGGRSRRGGGRCRSGCCGGRRGSRCCGSRRGRSRGGGRRSRTCRAGAGCCRARRSGRLAVTGSSGGAVSAVRLEGSTKLASHGGLDGGRGALDELAELFQLGESDLAVDSEFGGDLVYAGFGVSHNSPVWDLPRQGRPLVADGTHFEPFTLIP